MDKDGKDAPRRPSDKAGAGKAGGKASRPESPAHFRRALKSAYDDALREEVPKDFLDLLGKLN